MEMQISIPDLEDDQIYPLDGGAGFDTSVNQSEASHQDSTKPRPFRGATIEHSRSGSALSFESNTGSRTGTSQPYNTARGMGAGVTAPAATSNFSPSSTGFPRKSSFASLKAAFKGTSTTNAQDAYPQQLRNPFGVGQQNGNANVNYASSTGQKPSAASPIDANRAHGRTDSYLSSITSRSRGVPLSQQKHAQQSSLYSENSLGGNSTSFSESTNGSAFRSGPGLPPVPPFPEAYVSGQQPTSSTSLPPARTAYARSMSAQDRGMGIPVSQTVTSEMDGIPPLPRSNTDQPHYRSNNDPTAPSWMQGNAAILEDLEEPLQPPQRIFASSLHQRGSSRGSRDTSEDGARPSIDHQQAMYRGAGINAPTSSRWAGANAAQNMPPVREDRTMQRSQFMNGENSSFASLPTASPAEYAINVLCSRFLTLAGVRIRTAIGGVDESDPSLERNLGSGADDSLAHVSRKNPAPVIKSIFQWRDNMMEDRIDVGEVRGALAGSQVGLAMGVGDVANVLMRRKVLATAYLLSRTLIQIASSFSPGQAENSIKGLNDAQVTELQSRSFELMRECSREKIPSSKMQIDAFELASQLLGVLSKVCFAAVGDRFVAFLEQASRANSNTKEGDPASEVAVAAVRHLTITPFPMELFEEGAEFLEIMARNFAAAHGQRLKSTYAESLSALLMPVAKSASAELHHPTWTKALDSIAPRAFAMISKPRYWSVAYPLYVAVLCVSPEDRFQQPSQTWSWVQCLDAGVTKMNKDRGSRSIVMNAAVSLLWTYLFRCRESSSTTSKRLETFSRIWFPANRTTLFPTDVTNLEYHIYFTHYILYRQFDVGRDMVLDFLRAQLLSGNHLSVSPEALSKQRMTVAVRAILLTLDAHVKEISPSFPSDPKYVTEKSDFGDELPDAFTYPTPDIASSQAQFNDLIGKIALLCNHQIGGISVFSDAVSLTRGTSLTAAMAASKGLNDEERLLWRLHATSRFIAAYNRDHQPYIELLRACIDAWPRCLTANIPFQNVLNVLHRAYFSADPLLAEAAARCLKRIAEQRKGGATAVMTSFMRYLLRVDMVYWETHTNQLLILSKIEGAVKLLSSFLQIWLDELKKTQAGGDSGKKGWEMERTSAWAIIDEVEAMGLFLLCSAWRPLRRHALGILRIVSTLDEVFAGTTNKNPTYAKDSPEDFEKEDEPTRVIHLLSMPCARFIETLKDPRSEEASDISAWQHARMMKWRRTQISKETLAELAESDKSNESTNWLLVVPKFLRVCLDHFPTTVAVFRSIVTNRIIGMESAVSVAAGTSNRAPAGGVSTLKGQAVGAAGALMPFTALGNNSASAANATVGLTHEQNLMAEHWKMYILALCTTTTSIEGSAHRIKNTEGGVPSERVIAAKDLFQKLVPYLASDHAKFRESVISALGNINANLYKTLLETLQTVNAQLSSDFRRSNAKRNRQNERLRTALANVVQLTSTHMTSNGTLNDASLVYLILQWIKETFAFLTDREIRLDWEFHKLRRFFAGVVEEFFDSLYVSKENKASQENSEKLLNLHTRLHMFKLFQDWHSFSQAAKDGPAKLANLLANVAGMYREDRNREAILTTLRNETQMLSFHASCAMAALCQGVVPVSDSQHPSSANNMSLEPASLLTWLKHLYLSPSPQNHAVARRALKALLTHNAFNKDLIRFTLEHAVAEPEQTSATRSFFAVFAEVVVEKKGSDQVPLDLPQILCLGLVKLGHPDIDTRKKSFILLSSITPIEHGSTVIAAMEGGVSSPLPATYLRAQRDISTVLAEHFQEHKIAMLSEYALRLPEIDLSRRATTLGLLPEWLHRIQFTGEPNQEGSGVALSRRSMLVLSNLLAMTIRYGDEHNFEIQDMWASVAEGGDLASNATTIVKFLIQQALALRSSPFIMHAKRAVSCLSHTVLAPTLFAEMCSYIEPSSMIPVPLEQNRLTTFDAQLDHLYLANIEEHLPLASRKQTFSPGQVALLFVGELTYEKSPYLIEKLPLLLHAIFMQVDSTSAFTQEQVMSMFEQLMRSLSNEMSAGPRNFSSQVEKLFEKGTSIFWTQDEADFDASQTPKVMRNTVLDTISIVKNHIENLNERWGNVALEWATSNPVRHMACRSFQMFRILMPDVNYSMLADMLGRLSNTISDSVRIDNQSFALEILYTMKAVVRNINLDDHQSSNGKYALLGHIFWMNVACLSTVNESEFGQAVGLLHLLLEKLDLDNPETVTFLQAHCPDGWEGEIGGLQNLIMRGLRSASLYTESFNLLARMAKISDEHLIDRQDSRIGYLFIVSLAWFLQASDEPGSIDESLVTCLAEDIAALAAKNGKVDIERVATSVAKKRFRTTDDLLRFLPNHATGMALTLLALTFNAEPWLRKRTLQVLKIFFQSVDTRRQELHELGPELLMPLLRLLSTDLSLEALEVLEEKILASVPSAGANHSGQRRGPNAQQIVRMSLQWNNNPIAFQQGRSGPGLSGYGQGRNGPIGGPNNFRNARMPANQRWPPNPSQQRSTHNAHEMNSLFGIPEDSGWSVADVPDWTSRTRINILSVFKSVELLLDTPPVGEVNFVDDYDAEGENVFEQNMTASRTDMEELESASLAAGAKSGNAQSLASQNGVSFPGEQASLASKSSVAGIAMQENNFPTESEKDSIGDIVNQLHDLSSFFIDDEFTNASVENDDPSDRSSKRKSRKKNNASMGGNSTGAASLSSIAGKSDGHSEENSGEQIAKILSRSALANMMGRGHNAGGHHTNRTASEGGFDGYNNPMGDSTMIASSTSGDLSMSDVSGSIVEGGAPTSNKRHSMWARKALFGKRNNAALRSASETMPMPSNEDNSIPASTSAPLVSRISSDEVEVQQDGDETARS
ncbi:uncharacterized protein FA14DRAFT_165120 [Meira miltonrushii]|uniref:Uncharacterized protein n=1 Tax=Meira miltonrushii TaxID=1280837 RepID=A0A316VCI6_9BASI|nr:uncharacterized protein FA14DRAFT_165120 [Meira miltonrushii]PWN33933.1 hypothetical protein FA14DRAFT_165120 [Meira miltonrushii]